MSKGKAKKSSAQDKAQLSVSEEAASDPVKNESTAEPKNLNETKLDQSGGKKAEDSKAAKKAKRKKRWKRIILGIFLFGLAFRICLFFALPYLMEEVAASQGLDLSYESMDLSLLGADLELWGLELKQSGSTEADPALLEFQYCRADVSVLAVFSGRLVIRRLEADGVDLRLERDQAGRLKSIASILKAQESKPVEVEAVEEDLGEHTAGAIFTDLKPNIELSALRFQNFNIHWLDQAVEPNLDKKILCNLSLSNLGHAGRPARFEFELLSLGLLDSLQFEGKAEHLTKSIEASFDWQLAGLQFEPLRAYLESLSLNASAREWNARCNGALSLRVINDSHLQCHFELDSFVLEADRDAAFSLSLFEFDVVYGENGLALLGGQLGGGRALLEKQSNAQFEWAGLNLASSENLSSSSAPKSDKARSASKAYRDTAGRIERIQYADASQQFEKFELHDLKFGFVDHSKSPPAKIALHCNRLQFNRSPDKQAAVDIQGSFELVGLVQEIKIKGELTHSEESISLELQCDSSNLRPQSLESYLQPLGIELAKQDCQMRARFASSLKLGDETQLELALTDAYFGTPSDYASLKEFSIAGLSFGNELLDIKQIRMQQAEFSCARDEAGRLHFLGWVIDPAVEQSQAKARAKSKSRVQAGSLEEAQEDIEGALLADQQSDLQSAPELPAMRLQHLLFENLKFEFRDPAFASSGGRFAIEDAGLEIKNAQLLPAKFNGPEEVGTVKGWIRSSTVLGQATLNAKLSALPGHSQLSGEWTIDEIQLTAAEPLMTSAALKSDGSQLHMGGEFDFALMQAKEQLKLLASLQNNQLRSGSIEDGYYAARDSRLSLELAIDQKSGISLQTQISGPTLLVKRDAKGEFSFAGLRADSNTSTEPSKPQAGSEPSWLWMDLPALDFVAPLVEAKDLNIRIESESGQLLLEAAFQARLSGLSLIEKAPAAVLDAQFMLGDALDVSCKGEIALGEKAQNIALQFNALFKDAEQINALLPRGIKLDWKNGEAKGQFKLDRKRLAALHYDWKLSLAEMQFGNKSQDLRASLDNALLHFQCDAGKDLYQIVELSNSGGYLQFERRSESEWDLLGLQIDLSKLEPSGEAESKGEAANKSSASGGLKSLKQRELTFLLSKLQLRWDKILFVDSSGLDQGLELRDLAMTSPEPWRGSLGKGASEEVSQPLAITLGAKLNPLFEEISLKSKLWPFDDLLRLESEFSLEQLSCKEVSDFLNPMLSADLQKPVLSPSTDFTQASAKAFLSIKPTRPSGAKVDWARPMEINARLFDVALDSKQAERSYLALESLELRQAELNLMESSLKIEAVELALPEASLVRSPDGFAIGGLLIAPENMSKAPAEGSVQESQANQKPKTPTAAVVKTDANLKDAFKVNLRELRVEGLDLELLDEVAQPSAKLAFKDFEFLLENFTIGHANPKATKFSMELGSEPSESGGVPGPAAFARFAVLGKFQERNGKLEALIRSQLSAVDLLSLRATAKTFGVDLKSGIVDTVAQVRIEKDGSAKTSADVILTDLDLSEEEGGFLQSILKLPTPIGVAIFIVRDSSGSINLPLRFDLPAEGVHWSEFVRGGLSAVSQLLIKAIASSPFRLAKGMTDVVGLTEGKDAQGEIGEPQLLSLEKGELRLAYEQLKQFAPLIEQLIEKPELQVAISHECGSEDADWMLIQSQYTKEEALERVRQLRLQKSVLLGKRQELRQQAVRFTLANFASEGDKARASLGALDAELGQINSSLVELFDSMDPAAKHRTRQRLKINLMALGNERMSLIEKYFLQAGVKADQLLVKSKRVKNEILPGPKRKTGLLQKSLLSLQLKNRGRQALIKGDG